MVHEFPNMLMLMGPHTALGNIPRSIEYSVDWVTGLVRFAMERKLTRLEATPEGVASWTDHVKALGVGLLSNEVNSWIPASIPTSRASRPASSPATAAAHRRIAQGATRWRRRGMRS